MASAETPTTHKFAPSLKAGKQATIAAPLGAVARMTSALRVFGNATAPDSCAWHQCRHALRVLRECVLCQGLPPMATVVGPIFSANCTPRVAKSTDSLYGNGVPGRAALRSALKVGLCRQHKRAAFSEVRSGIRKRAAFISLPRSHRQLLCRS